MVSSRISNSRSLADVRSPLADDDPLPPLKLRVDALFASAAGRVGDSREELEKFTSRLHELAQAYVRERCNAPAAPDPKRQRLPSVVVAGGWEARRTSIAELEAEHGDGTYEEYELPLDIDDPNGRKLKVRQFSDYFFSSGCRVWDASAALARWILQQEVCIAKRDVLELGAGVGLVGVAAAYAMATRVVLTDNEALLLPNLRHNIKLFESSSTGQRMARYNNLAKLEVSPLDWSDPPADLVAAHGTFDVILASDVVYSSGAVTGLVGAVRALLKPGGTLLMSYARGRHGLDDFKAEIKAAGASCDEIRVPARFLKGTAQQGTAEEVAAHPFFVLRATWSPCGLQTSLASWSG